MKREQRRISPGLPFALLTVAFVLLALCPALLRARSAASYQDRGGRTKAGPTPTPTPKATPRPISRSTPRPIHRPTPHPVVPRRTAPQIEMVRISSGVFMMGSPETEEYHYKDEGPQHRVRVGSFYMGKYEVTQAQYRMVMGNSPSEFKGDNLPVENVSWNEAVEFIRRLNGMQSAYTYRLPTEAEWEYACRAGTTTPFAFGSSLSSNQANFDGSRPYGGASKGVYRLKTTRVGSFQPNAWGLYDMHGNVMEWCEDVWHEDYIGAPTDGSAWLDGGDQSRHVRRGGSWDSAAGGLRSAVRFSFEPGIALNYCGFRLAATAR